MSQDTFEASLKERLITQPVISSSPKRDKMAETIQLANVFTDSALKLISVLKAKQPLPQAV